MEVIAVSRSKPQWVEINGSKTWTSIIHSPTDAIRLNEDGIEGNDIAAHDAQVYAFFAHHYDYWRSRLGLPKDAWDWCHWGENITFRTDNPMDETNMNLGDKWRIGDTALLQICGARVPCFKLSWRCGQKDKWLKELADTGFSGVYLKVLAGGVVRPGDRASLVEKHKSSVTVACITQLSFNSNLKTKDTMDLLVRDPQLMSMNKCFFLHKLSIMHDQALVKKNHWKQWRPFRVEQIRQEGEGIKSFYIKPTDGEPLGTYLPGQFLTVRLPNGIERSWSLSDWADHDDPPYYRLSIKDAGKGSNWMHTKCNMSSKLLIRAPAGQFNVDWTPNFPGRQVYISAGIGITLLIAMLKAHLTHFALRKAPAIWLHVAQDEDHFTQHLLEEVLGLYDDQLRQEKILEIHIYFTRPKLRTVKPQFGIHGDVKVHCGCRPTLSTFSSLLSASYSIDPLKITPIEIPGPMSTCYICGPTPFEDDVKAHLRVIGVPDGLVKSENFANTAPGKVSTSIRKASVKFERSKICADWTAGEDPAQSQSLLELAEAMGLDPNYGCRAGACGACKVKLLGGSVAGGMQSDGVLVCVARPASQAIELEM